MPDNPSSATPKASSCPGSMDIHCSLQCTASHMCNRVHARACLPAQATTRQPLFRHSPREQGKAT
eukprot:8780567-Alexandrium_andersonii.AAC.1